MRVYISQFLLSDVWECTLANVSSQMESFIFHSFTMFMAWGWLGSIGNFPLNPEAKKYEFPTSSAVESGEFKYFLPHDWGNFPIPPRHTYAIISFHVDVSGTKEQDWKKTFCLRLWVKMTCLTKATTLLSSTEMRCKMGSRLRDPCLLAPPAHAT